MRRQDIRLRVLARQGDPQARLQIGKAYLAGAEGIPRSISVGLDHLRGASARFPVEAATCIARQLQLTEILKHGQMDMLTLAAKHDDDARLKLAALFFVRGEGHRGLELLQRSPGLASWLAGIAAESGSAIDPGAVLRAICARQQLDIVDVVIHEVSGALARQDLAGALKILDALVVPVHPISPELAEFVVDVLQHAEDGGQSLGDMAIALIEDSLEHCANSGNLYACFTLGRALAGQDCTHIPAQRLIRGTNLRKAAAWLLRAADGGNASAWLYLYRLCADYRCSVANTLMARFCLEKAAQLGLSEAERRLGALVLREATGFEEMEKAVVLLSSAAGKGDVHARRLLRSLVLPVAGMEEQAETAVAQVQRTAPLLAARLRVARCFGLTRLEAMSVNPVTGMRPWGLVVEKNPFIVKMRLGEPRAVPATHSKALQVLEGATRMFSSDRLAEAEPEGPLRVRLLQQRRLFERLHIDERLFFASANSQQREMVRIGTKWAQRQRDSLQLALAESDH